MGWIPILYRDFYDVPRAFIAEHEGTAYFFDCPFDAAFDDYPSSYMVYRLAPATKPTTEESWEGLSALGQYVRNVLVAEITFDQTRRASIESAVYTSL